MAVIFYCHDIIIKSKKMKSITPLLVSIILISCTGNTQQSQPAQAKKDSVVQTNPAPQQVQPASAFSPKQIITTYLQLKNALTADNAKEAASAGASMMAALPAVNAAGLSGEQLKTYTGLYDDMKEHAGHINQNAGKIAHQREHFIMLSKDMADFIKTFGNGGQTLYKDFCPMANEGKGAVWISETEAIKNPYYGNEMIACGIIKETIK
jgi:hypothetical protein